MSETTGYIEAATDITTGSPSPRAWYAVYTHSRAEKRVLQRIEDEGLEAFLPMQKCIRKWSDRKKLIDKPIISSYVFVKVKKRDFSKVLKTMGVVKFIMFEGQPVTIPEEQILNLKILSDSDAEVFVSNDVFLKGDMVEVLYGSLVGLRGELVRVGNRRTVVMRVINSGLNLTVDIHKIAIRKLKEKKLSKDSLKQTDPA